MKKKLFFAIAVVLFALVLRLYAAVLLPTDYDEPVYFTAARYYAHAIQKDELEKIPAVDFNYEHPALAKIVYGAALSVLPYDGFISEDVWQYFMYQEPLVQTWNPLRIFVLRLVSVIFGTLAVAVLALISPLAALAMAVDSISIKYTSVIYLEALPLFLTALSAWLFSQATNWLKHKENSALKDHKKELILLVISALCLGAATACKYQYGIVGFAMFIFYLVWIIPYRPKDLARYGILLGFVLVSVASFVAADPYLYSDPIVKLSQSMSFSLGYQNGETVKAAGYPFYQPLVWLSQSVPAFVDREVQPMPSTGREFPIQLDTLIFILAIIGLPKLFKDHPVFFIWLVTGLLFLLIWSTKWPQYAMLVVTPLCLSASQGILMIYDLVKKSGGEVITNAKTCKLIAFLFLH